MKTRRLFIPLALGLGLSLGLLWLLGWMSDVACADPGIRYVAPDGDDSKLCDSIADRCRTVQRAIDVADPLDEIRVATGTYTDAAGTVAGIDKTVTLLGGWDGGFTTRDPNAYSTTMDAQGNGRVVYISGNISPTIDGFTITNGNANDEATGTGQGGGIYSEDASPVIQNNIIISNKASISPTSGSGGGIYLYGASASAFISGNQVLSNTVHSTLGDRGGGGISLDHGAATIQGNLIQGNVCSRAGGGLHSQYSSSRILDNEIRGNEAGNNGGGIYSRNLDCPLIQGNLIINNVAGWNGGGIMASHATTPTIVANRVFSNTGYASVGLGGSGYFTVTNNFIAHSNYGGIALWSSTRFGLMAHNTIVSNTEWGICLHDATITPTIVNNIVAFNTYGIQAGANASGTLDYNDMWGNTTQDYDLPGAPEPGPHDIQADPLFVDPANDDYHLRPGSPCIDAGTDVGVMSDIDGDVRPIGPRADIGADEARRWVYLPLVLRNFP